MNIEKDDKYRFLWSILAHLHPCNNHHPNRVSNYRQYFNELNIQDFDLTNGFKCSHVHRLNELKKVSVNIFELNFHQDQNKWKHKLTPIQISKNDSDKVINLMVYKNHYVLIKKLNMFLGDHHKNFICRRRLNSYTRENMSMMHKQKCGDDNITTIKLQMNHIFNGKKNIFIGIHCNLE